MPFRRPNLFFDQIEVIEQPFSGWRNPQVRLNCLGQQIADADKNPFIFSQPIQQWVCGAFRAQCVGAGQGLAVPLIWSRALFRGKGVTAGFAPNRFRAGSSSNGIVPGNGFAAYVQGRELFSGSEVSMEPERVVWQLANLPYLFTLETVNLNYLDT
jgi:hypothetical protein